MNEVEAIKHAIEYGRREVTAVGDFYEVTFTKTGVKVIIPIEVCEEFGLEKPYDPAAV